MGNKNLVITIEREYGSGGRIVGRRLAEELGIHFYDDEILKLTSEKSAIGEEYFRLADEKAGNNLLHRIVGRKLDFTEDPVLSGNVTAPENLFRFQSSVIRELARGRILHHSGPGCRVCAGPGGGSGAADPDLCLR